MPDPIDTSTTFVPMKHKETGGVAMATIDAVTQVHSQNGWDRVSADNVTEDELNQLISDNGILVPGDASFETKLQAVNPDLVDNVAEPAPTVAPAKADSVKTEKKEA